MVKITLQVHLFRKLYISLVSAKHSSTWNPSGIVYPPALFSSIFSGLQEVPAYPSSKAKSKMAVSPYVSRAELWLANASFRPSFRLPEEFHPSIFLKWFPGSMAKGESFTILGFLRNLPIS